MFKIFLEMAKVPNQKKILLDAIMSGLIEMQYHRTNATAPKFNLLTSDSKQIKKIIEASITGLSVELSDPIYKKVFGGLSDDMTTYNISLKKNITIDYVLIEKGTMVQIANAFKEGAEGEALKVLGDKSLTPMELGLENKKWLSAKDIKKMTLIKYNSMFGDTIKSLIEHLCNEIILKVSAKPLVKGLIDIKDNEETTVELSDDSLALIESINSSDVNIIAKNFGEILGGIYFLQKYSANNVFFPGQSNYQLIDFIVDDVIFISSKAGAGAAPSISSLANKVNESPKAFAKIDNRLKKILADVVHPKTSVLQTYVNAAEIMDTEIYKQMLEHGIVGETDKDTKILVNDFLVKKFAAFGEDEEKMLKFLRNKYWKHANDPNVTSVLNNIRSGLNAEGAIIYPMESELVKKMNTDPGIIGGLNFITKTVGVKQLYFDFEINKKKKNIKFLIKFFEKNDFKFALTTSANNYTNSNISFKMQ